MGLNQTEKAVIQKAISVGNSDLALALSEQDCIFLLLNIIRDLKLQKYCKDIEFTFADFFAITTPIKLSRAHSKLNFIKLIEFVAAKEPNVVTYFSCLATLFKARLKFQRILEQQPLASAEQVGPRTLLQHGTMSARSIAHFLVWRKWLYDIDNRAAQETGYVFEPIIAHSIGGVPVSANKSPIRRNQDPTKGRQVDCILGKKAYEIKMRVTIAASGQGRWGEELEFPVDCRASGYTPVLIVFDSTENPKLTELKKVFLKNKGLVYIGKEAWSHLEMEAGKAMGIFIDKYVREPMELTLKEISNSELDPLTLTQSKNLVSIKIGKDVLKIERNPLETEDSEVLPDDVDSAGPGVE